MHDQILISKAHVHATSHEHIITLPVLIAGHLPVGLLKNQSEHLSDLYRLYIMVLAW
jgi:hypothetical protein